MKNLLIRISLALRYCLCRIIGHNKARASVSTIGVLFCRRCMRITDQRTIRRVETHGDVERRMRAITPAGYSFVDCNWKKRKAKFVSDTGVLKHVSF